VRRFPPVAQLATLSLVLVIVGGIVMVSAMPNEPSLAVPVALLALSAVILTVNVVLLVTLRDLPGVRSRPSAVGRSSPTRSAAA